MRRLKRDEDAQETSAWIRLCRIRGTLSIGWKYRALRENERFISDHRGEPAVGMLSVQDYLESEYTGYHTYGPREGKERTACV